MANPIPILRDKGPPVPIDIRMLRYFVETMRLQGFTQATSSFSITQSTASEIVRQLEDEVGQPLLIREGKQMRLIDVGRVVYARGQETLGVVHRLTPEIADLSSLRRSELTVDIPPTVNLFSSPVVSAFRQRYPNLVLNLAKHDGKTVEQQVASGELEVGATTLPGGSGPKPATRQSAKHPTWAMGPCKARWVKDRAVTLTALRDEPLLLLAEDLSLTRKLRQTFLEVHTEPHITARSRYWEFLASMAAVGLGTTFLPQPLVANLANRDKLVVARLIIPDMDRALAHLWSPGRYLSHATRARLVMYQEVLGA